MSAEEGMTGNGSRRFEKKIGEKWRNIPSSCTNSYERVWSSSDIKEVFGGIEIEERKVESQRVHFVALFIRKGNSPRLTHSRALKASW